MPSSAPPVIRQHTTNSPGSGGVVQFSIFLSNKAGVLLGIVNLLNEHHVHVLAMSIGASADAAIVRLVVSDPESVEGIFHLHSIAYALCPLVIVEMKEASQFSEVLNILLAAEINVLGAYALLSQPRGFPTLALHLEDDECASRVLRSSGFAILLQEDLSR